MRKINHKTQFSANGCVPACIAMLSDLTAESAETLWLPQLLDGFIGPATMARAVGLSVRDEMNMGFSTGCIPVVYTPSLNEVGAFHAVLIDARDIYNIQVFDPAMGFKLRTEYPEGEPRECLQPVDIMAQYYVWRDEEGDVSNLPDLPPNAVRLTSFIQVCTIAGGWWFNEGQ